MRKQCCTCKADKDIKEFSKNKTQKDGLQRSCKSCCDKSREKFKGEYSNQKSKEWRLNNQEDFRKQRKEWYKKNSYKWTNYFKKRREDELYFRLVTNLRSRIWHALKGKGKKDSTLELLNCTANQFKAHLEKQFTKGMSWDNYGKWHVDHKKPCAAFDLTKEEEQKKCFHYTNLQPLWAKDNRTKSDKY